MSSATTQKAEPVLLPAWIARAFEHFGDLTDVIENVRLREECNGKTVVMGFVTAGRSLLSPGPSGHPGRIPYHGSFVGNYLDPVPDVGCPLSFHWGDNDRRAPMELIDEVKQSLRNSTMLKCSSIPAVSSTAMLPGHGAAYNEAAAEQSWERTFSLLRRV